MIVRRDVLKQIEHKGAVLPVLKALQEVCFPAAMMKQIVAAKKQALKASLMNRLCLNHFAGLFLYRLKYLRAFGKVLEHVVEQLTSIEGADVNLTLEITAEIPSGIDNNKRRTLLENASNLSFSKDIS